MAEKSHVADSAAEKRGALQWLRRVALWLCALVACVTFVTYVVVRWVERQILTTDNWVAMVAPLPKQKVVSDALGRQIGQKVFDGQVVQARITEALPPRADFLAGPLTNQLAGVTVTAAQRIVASDVFQTIWEGANRLAMNRLLATARGQTPPLQAKINERFDINLSNVSGSLRGALGKVGQVVPELQPASQKVIDVSTNLQARPRRVQQVVRTIDTLAAVLPLAIAAGFFAAVAFARRRRRTIGMIAVAAAVLLLVELIGLKWLRGYTLDQVRHAENASAVGYVFDTVSTGLRDRLIVALLITLLIMLICWLLGPARWARRIQSLLALDRIPGSRVSVWWSTLRAWVGKWKFYLWLAVALLVLIGLAFVTQVTGRVALNAVLLIITLWAIVWILATPHLQRAGAEA